MNRIRGLIAAVVAVVLAVSLAACGALDEGSGDTKGVVKAKKGSTVVNVGYLHTIAVDDKLWLGQIEGYFARQGLDIKARSYDTGIALSQALNGGDEDVAIMGGVTSNFPAQGQGKVFMLNSVENATAQLWVQPGSEISSVAELKGRKIVTTTGTTADIFLQRALTKAGLSRDDVTIVNSQMPTAVQTFNSSSVDAIALWVPFDLQVAKGVPGSSSIANAGQYPDAAVGDGWIANNDWYAKNKPTIKKLIKGWLQANAAFRADPSGSLKKVWKVAYKDDAKLSDLQHQVKYQTDHTNDDWVRLYQDGSVLQVVGQAERAFVELGGLDKYVDPKQWFDTSLFLSVAQQQ